MSHTPPPSSLVLPSHTSALHELLELFGEMGVTLGRAIRFTEADCQRMILVARNGAESLNQLKSVLDTNPGFQEGNAREELSGQISGSMAVFRQASQQIQFYDLLQQQLAHLAQTHQLSTAEVRACLQAKGDQPVPPVRYLYALSDIVQLHTIQLTRIREEYEAEIVSWQNHLQRAMEKLIQSYTKWSSTSETALCQKSQSGTNPTQSLQRLVAEVIYVRQLLREQELSPDQFNAAISFAQNALVQIAKRATHLSLLADAKARTWVLMQIRQGYTMQIERVLHDQILAGLGRPTPVSDVHPSHEHDTQEIELF